MQEPGVPYFAEIKDVIDEPQELLAGPLDHARELPLLVGQGRHVSQQLAACQDGVHRPARCEHEYQNTEQAQSTRDWKLYDGLLLQLELIHFNVSLGPSHDSRMLSC